MNSNWKLLPAALLVAVLAIAGCGGGGDDTPTEPMDTAYEMALDAIQAAETAAEAQEAYDAVDLTAVTGDEAGKLMAALTAKQEALATAARIAEQTAALAMAAAAVDTSDLSTREAITAAQQDILALEMALAGATDLSDADKMGAESILAAAKSAVSTATAALDLDDRKMAQSADLSMKATALQTALDGFSGIPTESEIAAAQAALDALNAAIAEAVDLDDAAKNAARLAVASAEGRIETAEAARVAEDARKAAADKAAADKAAADKAAADKAAADKAAADKAAADKAMAVTAAKLYPGISAQMGAGDGSTFAATDRDAYYNSDATAILVSSGDGTNTPTEVSATLSEDKDTVVAVLHGWAGKRYADPAGGDMYEAVVYSNVEAPKQGRKFGSADAVTPTGDFEYQLTSGSLTNAQLTAAAVGTTPAAASRIVLNGVTRTAGTESYNLPANNPSGISVITVSGSFHGVPGTYSCATDAATACTAAVAAKGFTLGGGTGGWTFKPSDANARVMDSADIDYASYGWWLKKTENDATYTASAFVDEKGTVNAASNLNALNGTATYQGGAAGKYALASSTGGTNDAGHFTARATLEANFSTNTAETAITGTIDDFMGADGQSRAWSVKLNGSQIGDDGEIGNASASTDVDTVWTIGDDAAGRIRRVDRSPSEQRHGRCSAGCDRHVLLRVRHGRPHGRRVRREPSVEPDGQKPIPPAGLPAGGSDSGKARAPVASSGDAPNPNRVAARKGNVPRFTARADIPFTGN